MRKVYGIMLLLLYIMSACSTEQTNSFGKESGADLEQKNALITHYELLALKEALDSSLQKNIFEKEGFPHGYELSINEELKETVLTIRPVTEKDYPSFEKRLTENVKDTLYKEGYSEYAVKIIPLWNKTNLTTRQFDEEKIVNLIVNEMKSLHQIDVLPGIHFAETDGRIVSLDLVFKANGAEITDMNLLNQYSKEFIRLAEEKGLNAREISIHFGYAVRDDWKNRVTPALKKGLQQMEELHISSVTLINESSPVIINTSVHSTENKVKELGKRIEETVQEFHHYLPVKDSYRGLYDIHVLSADNEKINL